MAGLSDQDQLRKYITRDINQIIVIEKLAMEY